MRLLGASLAIAVLAGCVSTRDTVAPRFDAAVNPAQGIPVRIDKVEDLRNFQVKPASPATPSLMNDQISDEATRARAFGRKRNSYGMALGDVLLPEGQTVAGMTEAVVTRSLRESGYRVVSRQDADYAQAKPLSVRVNKLWVWQDLTAFAGGLVTDYDVVVTDPTGAAQQGVAVSGAIKARALDSWNEGLWPHGIRIGLEEINTKLKAALAAARR
jgi:hypothetical protein